jgi:hypothetical protein
MILHLNDSLEMKVDLTKVDQDLFQLVIEKIFTDEKRGSFSSKTESFLTKDQVALFVNHINEVSHDYI